uniref:Si:ch211-153b23.5 n=1 Tax=Acanthochromis polyacanthus TaxID=80966 RepID=A0A3Q1G2M8_9TELE
MMLNLVEHVFLCLCLIAIMVKRVAVILSGCGVYDGTEIHEASAVLVHLSRAGAKVQMFAPNADQMHVVNHCEGKPTEEKRNVLQESARIARGDVTDLAKLDVSAFDAAIIPGGFGVAKNLSDWAVKNKDCTIQPHVEKLIKDFHKAGKPLGMCCISPILAAKILPGCELTVGQDKECEKWVKKFFIIIRYFWMFKKFNLSLSFFPSSGGRMLRQQVL